MKEEEEGSLKEEERAEEPTTDSVTEECLEEPGKPQAS